jgi:hypothetical protein
MKTLILTSLLLSCGGVPIALDAGLTGGGTGFGGGNFSTNGGGIASGGGDASAGGTASSGGGTAASGGGSISSGGGSVSSAGGTASSGGGTSSGGGSVSSGGGTASSGGGSVSSGGGTVASGGGSVSSGGGSVSSGGGTVASGGGTVAAGGGTPLGYFVSTSGIDTAAGTFVAPFKTIQRAITAVGVGSGNIFVRAGTYAAKISITGTGASTEGILSLQPYNNESVIIDGSGLTVANGQQGLITLTSRSNVTIQNFEIRNFRGTRNNVPLGIYVTGHGSNLSILNNHIHDIVQMQESCNGGDAFGLAVYGTDATPWTNVRIEGNEVNNLKTGCSESLTVNGNVDGFNITGNNVHNNDNIGIDAIGFEGSGPTPAVDQARNGTIRGNTVANITSFGNPAYGNARAADGIYVDGAKNIVIEQNTVRNVDIGIEVASEMSGRASSYVLVRNNAVANSASAGVSIGGYDSMRGSTDHCIILNNTLYQNSTELQAQFYVTTTLFQNNLLYNSTGTYRSGSQTGITSVTNLQKTGTVANVFVGAPLNLRPATSVMAIGTGTNLSACPSGFTCPSIWTLPLHGNTDVMVNPRVVGGIDIGAYEQ